MRGELKWRIRHWRLTLKILGYAAAIAIGLVLITGADQAKPTYTLESLAPTKDFVQRPFGLLSFDGRTRCYRWVLEHLDAKTTSGDRAGLSFHKDAEVPDEFSPSPAEYAGSGYDIGHGAPARDNGPTKEAIKATETVANACPQFPELNRGPWSRAEAYCFEFAHGLGVREVFVVTAPAWIPEHNMLHLSIIGRKQGHGIWVPTHCIKSMLVVFNDGSMKMKTWRFTNSKEPEAFEDAEITADQAETDLGLDLWPGLDKKIQDQLESQTERAK